jgi:hypothetical protein
MKKTNLLFAVIAFFIALSCSKSSTSSSSSSGQKKVKTFKLYNNADNKLLEEFIFQYKNGKLSGIIQNNDFFGNVYMDIKYIDPYNTFVTTYKDTNKLSSQIYGIYLIKYNSVGDVIFDSTVHYPIFQRDTFILKRSYQYYSDSIKVNYSNRGIDNIIVKNENLVNLYNYDNNINPLYSLKPVFGHLFLPYNNSYFSSYFITKNNLINIGLNNNIYFNCNCIYDIQGDLVSCKEYQDRNIKYTYY